MSREKQPPALVVRDTFYCDVTSFILYTKWLSMFVQLASSPDFDVAFADMQVDGCVREWQCPLVRLPRTQPRNCPREISR